MNNILTQFSMSNRCSLAILCLTLGICIPVAAVYNYLMLHVDSATIHPADSLVFVLNKSVIADMIALLSFVALTGVALALLISMRKWARSFDELSFIKTLEAIPDSAGITRINDSRIVYSNTAFSEFIGYENDEVLGKTTIDLNLWEDTEKREEMFGLLQEKGQLTNFEAALTRKDGEVKPVLISACPINFYGEACLLIIVRNVSEQKSVENSLRHTEERYRAFFSQTSEAVIHYKNQQPVDTELPVDQQIIDICKATIVECNDVAPRIYGFENAGELPGKRYSDLVDIKSTDIQKLLTVYICNDYQVNGHVTRSFDCDNNPVYVETTATGIIENGRHIGVWVTLKDVTERVRAAQALEASEEKFSKAFHASPDAIVITSLENGKVIEINQGCFRMLGYYPRELIGKSLMDLGIYVEPEARMSLIDQVVRIGSAHDIETELRTKTGDVISVLFSAEKIILADQPCIITSFRDITYRKKTERELSRYEKIVSAIKDSILVLNEDMEYEYVNSTYCKFIGKSNQKLIGKSLTEVLGQEKEDLMEYMIRGLQGEELFFEREREDEYGIKHYNEVHVSRFRNTDDDNWSLLTVGRDITERKHAETALRRSENHYRSLVEATQVIPWELNFDKWAPTYVGPQALIKIGYELSSWMGNEFWTKFIDPEDRQEVVTFYRMMAELEQSGEIQYRIVTENKEVFWINDIVNVVRDENNCLLLQGMMINITETVEREMQLAHAQKMEAVGRLTGGISHDFNNLLTIINGNLNLISDLVIKDADDDIREIIDDAISASKDGAELTEQLLSFSRKQPLKPKTIAINELIDNSSRMFRRTLGENIVFNSELSKLEPLVYIDAYKFENALLNLLINARDALDEHGVLSISTGRTEIDRQQELNLKTGSYVTVSVTDNGVGMDRDTLKSACEPFYTTKGATEGSGLGLSMVYGFVNQSQGAMKIDSIVGKGTTVTLFLPEATEEIDKLENSNIAKPGLGKLTGVETILVTEDESRVRNFATRSLKSLGYDVIEAKDASEAMRIIETNNEIDILFSDNMLPGKMKGIELANQARELRPELKVILTTGFTSREGKFADIYDGKFPLLIKPYSIEELSNQIRNSLCDKNLAPGSLTH